MTAKTSSDRESYPRVLVINGYGFDESSGTGLTLLSLFRGWPASRLACLHFSRIEPSEYVCERMWRLGREDDVLVGPLVRRLRRGAGDPTQHGEREEGDVAREGGRATRVRRILSAQHVLEASRFVVPPRVRREIVEYRPQVVYSMLASNRIMRTVLDVASETSAPIVPHFMDDWPSTLYRRSVLGPLLRWRMSALLREVLRRSPIRMVIGQEMATAFQERYGGCFEPFMNAVEPEALSRGTEPPPATSGVLFTYVGGLHLNRWKSLRDIGARLKDLQDKGVQCELRVYTQARFAEEAKRLDLPGVIRLMGPAEPSDVPRILREAHILVHAESFDEGARRYARYSISTKVPECMAARRPLLAYGPAEVASIAYVARSGAGIAVGERNSGALHEALEALASSGPLRRQLGERAGGLAASCHDAVQQRESFRCLLAKAARERAQVLPRSS